MTLFAELPADACRAYVNLRAGQTEHAQAGREHCLDLWRDFEPLADRHFRAEFPLHLHERWFEMYVTVSLLRAGYQVTAPKPGPDVLLMLNGRRIWIEATCATGGEPGRPDTVSEPPMPRLGEPPIVTDRPTNAMTLRIRAAVDTKQAKFAEYQRQGIVLAGDVTAIAVNVHAVPGAWADMDDLMMRALYGLGDIAVSIDRATGKAVDVQRVPRPVLAKASGAQVAVRPFADGSLAHVSAVIGSREDAGNLPPRLGGGLAVYPNLTAAQPWRAGDLTLGTEWLPQSQPDGSHNITRHSYAPKAEPAPDR